MRTAPLITAGAGRDELLARAREASTHAYAPYSRFPVGAAVTDVSGRIHTGCNVENVSFGLTQCAERNAVGAAIVAGVPAGELGNLLIFTPRAVPTAPCGACRQVLIEVLSPSAIVIACNGHGQFTEWPVGELLPDAFLPGSLDKS